MTSLIQELSPQAANREARRRARAQAQLAIRRKDEEAVGLIMRNINRNYTWLRFRPVFRGMALYEGDKYARRLTWLERVRGVVR